MLLNRPLLVNVLSSAVMVLAILNLIQLYHLGGSSGVSSWADAVHIHGPSHLTAPDAPFPCTIGHRAPPIPTVFPAIPDADGCCVGIEPAILFYDPGEEDDGR